MSLPADPPLAPSVHKHYDYAAMPSLMPTAAAAAAAAVASAMSSPPPSQPQQPEPLHTAQSSSTAAAALPDADHHLPPSEHALYFRDVPPPSATSTVTSAAASASAPGRALSSSSSRAAAVATAAAGAAAAVTAVPRTRSRAPVKSVSLRLHLSARDLPEPDSRSTAIYAVVYIAADSPVVVAGDNDDDDDADDDINAYDRNGRRRSGRRAGAPAGAPASRRRRYVHLSGVTDASNVSDKPSVAAAGASPPVMKATPERQPPSPPRGEPPSPRRVASLAARSFLRRGSRAVPSSGRSRSLPNSTPATLLPRSPPSAAAATPTTTTAAMPRRTNSLPPLSPPDSPPPPPSSSIARSVAASASSRSAAAPASSLSPASSRGGGQHRQQMQRQPPQNIFRPLIELARTSPSAHRAPHRAVAAIARAQPSLVYAPDGTTWLRSAWTTLGATEAARKHGRDIEFAKSFCIDFAPTNGHQVLKVAFFDCSKRTTEKQRLIGVSKFYLSSVFVARGGLRTFPLRFQALSRRDDRKSSRIPDGQLMVVGETVGLDSRRYRLDVECNRIARATSLSTSFVKRVFYTVHAIMDNEKNSDVWTLLFRSESVNMIHSKKDGGSLEYNYFSSRRLRAAPGVMLEEQMIRNENGGEAGVVRLVNKALGLRQPDLFFSLPGADLHISDVKRRLKLSLYEDNGHAAGFDHIADTRFTIADLKSWQLGESSAVKVHAHVVGKAELKFVECNPDPRYFCLSLSMQSVR